MLDALTTAVVQPLMESIAELKKDNDKKTAQITRLQNDLSKANSHIEALEQQSRRDNLVITGLPIESFAEAASTSANSDEPLPSTRVEQSVIQMFNDKLGLTITQNDISIAHRLKKNPSDTRPPSIIVKFTNRKAREAVYAARRKLKPPSGADPAHYPRIYINEDLTKHVGTIFQRARQIAKAKLIHSTWTSACSMYVKDSSEPNSKPRKITSIDELPSVPTRSGL